MNQQTPIERPGDRAGAASPAPAFGAALFTVLVWALSFPLTKFALHQLQPLPLAAARFAVASLPIMTWLAWKRPPLPSWPDRARFLVCGLIGIAIYNALLNAGQQTVSASAASFIVNTVPILTALFAMLFLDERFTAWGWIGALIGLAGVGVIVADQPGGFSLGSGATLVFGSAVAQAAFFVIQRPLVARYGALASTAYALLAGAILLGPWLPQGGAALIAEETSQRTILAVVALALFPAVLGYAAWAFAIGQLGASRAATFLYLVPPVATLLAFALSGETPGGVTLAGGLIAIGGVALVNARGRSRS